MLELLMWVAIFVAALATLIKSADWFTNGAERLGLRLGIPEFIVGMTIVSIGTSLPELITSAIAASEGHAQLLLDNVVGSNIANVFLILGVSAVVARGLTIKRDLIDLDLPILAASQVLAIFMIWDGQVTFVEALISLGAMLLYVMYTLREKTTSEHHHHKKESILKLSGILLASGVLVFLGAKFTVDSLLTLGELLGVGASVLAATALAVGTSLPELAVSVAAARKGQFELSVGNIFGSNIFNTTGIVGLVGLFTALPASELVLTVGIPFMAAAMGLCVISGISRKFHSWEGAFFLLLFALYIARSFGVV